MCTASLSCRMMGTTSFARWRANAQVLANAGHFARSLEECLPETEPLRSGSPSIRRAIPGAEPRTDQRGTKSPSWCWQSRRSRAWQKIRRGRMNSGSSSITRPRGWNEPTATAKRPGKSSRLLDGCGRRVFANGYGSCCRPMICRTCGKTGTGCTRGVVASSTAGRKQEASTGGSHLEQSSLHALGQRAIKLCARIVLFDGPARRG